MILALIFSFITAHASECPKWMKGVNDIVQTTHQKTMEIGRHKWVVTQTLTKKKKNIFVIESTSGVKNEINIPGHIYDFDMIDAGVKGEELPSVIVARKSEDSEEAGHTEIVLQAWNETQPMLPNNKSDLIINGHLNYIQTLSSGKEKLLIGVDKEAKTIHLIDLARLQAGTAPLKRGFSMITSFFPQKIQVGEVTYLMTQHDGIYYFSEQKSGRKLGFFSHIEL